MEINIKQLQPGLIFTIFTPALSNSFSDKDGLSKGCQLKLNGSQLLQQHACLT